MLKDARYSVLAPQKKTHGLQNETKDALISIAQTNQTNHNKETKK